ncbi:MAG: Sensor protein ZraS [Candidatus Anoxychlamydiales bacterium]|nr:Sensor protein ZraS [Candidatus Anoxychlamydiales bacterium]
MSDILNQLNNSANLALRAKSTQESMKHLAKAFALFSKETTRLENANVRLLDRFNKINSQLRVVENELIKKISDLDAVSLYLNNILKNISQGILYIDLTGIVTTYNQKAQSILEIEEKKVLFNKYLDNFKDDFFGFSIKDALNYSMFPKTAYITIKTKNAKKLIEITPSFIWDCPKNHKGLILLLKDFTDLQKLQTRANRKDRLNQIGQITTSIAHEIKNPLGSIRGFASLLYKDLENSKPLQDLVSYILDGTKALERVANNVLEYAREVILEIKSIDISSLIKEIVKSIKIDPTFSRNVKINLDLIDAEHYIPADRDLLKSAILNIIINAYQAMDESGYLSISIFKNISTISINISDTGRGIEKKDLENIFTPFFTTKQRGNGLGLPEAHKIISAHLGSLEVRSLINKGSTFTITLPNERK